VGLLCVGIIYVCSILIFLYCMEAPPFFLCFPRSFLSANFIGLSAKDTLINYFV
jgi:hypothetical protein